MVELTLTETNRTTVPQATLKEGHTSFSMAANNRLQIKNTADSGHIYNEACPTGKSWEVVIAVRIIETSV